MILSNKTASVNWDINSKIHENKAVIVNRNVFYILCIVNGFLYLKQVWNTKKTVRKGYFMKALFFHTAFIEACQTFIKVQMFLCEQSE